MKQFQKLILILSLVSGALLVSNRGLAQDGVKMNPDNHKVLLDDENVRVYEVTVAPGQKMAMHSHPRHVVYALTDGTMTLTADGKSQQITLKAGEAKDMEAVTHTTENTGSSEVRLVVVEIKKDMGMMKSKGMKDKMEKKTDKKM